LDSHFVVIFLNDGQGNFVAADPANFPGVKGTEHRLIAPADIAAGQLAMQSGRDSSGDADAFAGCCREQVTCRAGLPAAQPMLCAELTFPSAGRAPPLV